MKWTWRWHSSRRHAWRLWTTRVDHRRRVEPILTVSHIVRHAGFLLSIQLKTIKTVSSVYVNSPTSWSNSEIRWGVKTALVAIVRIRKPDMSGFQMVDLGWVLEWSSFWMDPVFDWSDFGPPLYLNPVWNRKSDFFRRFRYVIRKRHFRSEFQKKFRFLDT